jgi:hypothetical protein
MMNSVRAVIQKWEKGGGGDLSRVVGPLSVGAAIRETNQLNTEGRKET